MLVPAEALGSRSRFLCDRTNRRANIPSEARSDVIHPLLPGHLLKARCQANALPLLFAKAPSSNQMPTASSLWSMYHYCFVHKVKQVFGGAVQVQILLSKGIVSVNLIPTVALVIDVVVLPATVAHCSCTGASKRRDTFSIH